MQTEIVNQQIAEANFNMQLQQLMANTEVQMANINSEMIANDVKLFKKGWNWIPHQVYYQKDACRCDYSQTVELPEWDQTDLATESV